MDFGEALMAMRAGKRVRRKVWVDGTRLWLVDGEFHAATYNTTSKRGNWVWEPNHLSVLGTDWEVVEEVTV